MSVALRTITRLQDADDINVSLGVGVDGYALCWDNDTAKFVLRAVSAGVTDHGALTGLSDDDHTGYLLATGARTGASAAAQPFTNGIIGPSWKPTADSTTALQLQNAAGAYVLNVDTTNGRLGIGTNAPDSRFVVSSPDVFVARFMGSNAQWVGFEQLATATNAKPYLQLYNSYNNQKAWIELDPAVGNQYVAIVYGSPATRMLVIKSTGNVGIGTTAPAALLHADQSRTTGAVPVLTVDQADVSEEFIRFIGTSTTDATQSLVDAADMTTPGALAGWLKIYVQDDAASGAITDAAYYVPFYAAPTA